MNRIVMCLAAVSTSLLSMGAIAADLKVSIPNAKNNNGTISAALWNTANGFPDKGDPKLVRLDNVKAGQNILIFKDIDPATYAISLFHDENGNSELDTNFLGIPSEGYGFSNNATGSFGPASFEDAAFQFEATDLEMEISLIY
ncbi:MAG: DUF2141 domain-containing protein [Sneathiella sp.]